MTYIGSLAVLYRLLLHSGEGGAFPVGIAIFARVGMSGGGDEALVLCAYLSV